MVSEEGVVAFARGLLGAQEGKSREGWRLFYRGEKIFLAIFEGVTPLRIETRCDKKLAKLLRERYESVMEGLVLGREGIEILDTGQLRDEEIFDLIRHSFEISV